MVFLRNQMGEWDGLKQIFVMQFKKVGQIAPIGNNTPHYVCAFARP